MAVCAAAWPPGSERMSRAARSRVLSSPPGRPIPAQKALVPAEKDSPSRLQRLE